MSIAAKISIVSAAIALSATVSSNSVDMLPDLDDPRLVVRKSERRLDLYDRDRLIRSFRIVLGSSPIGDKETEGDGRTPEGEFYVFAKNPKSKFHLSLGLSYPGVEDAERGLREGLIKQEEYDEILTAIAEKRMPLQKTRLGGEIYIHGGGTASDWTEGCVALDNDAMTELFERIPVGTKVTVLP
jgi:murein L,D-transpeptidase YafK